MAYSVVDVDPDLYVEAGDRARRAARQVREAVDAAVGGHANSHNAAGSGDAGNAFADGHDQAARRLLRGAAKLATALDDVADRMALSAHTHAAAEWASSGRAGDPPGYPVPAGSQSTTFGSIPTMHGGTGATPRGWEMVQLVMSFLEYPDADTGKVRHAGSVWTTLGEELSRIQASLIDDILEPLASLTAPDIAVIQAAVEPIIAFGRGVAQVPAEIAAMCHRFAGLAEEVGELILSVLEQLLIAVVAEEAGGALLALVTMGASELVANGAAVAEVTTVASRIVVFLGEFGSKVLLVIERVKGILAWVQALASPLKEGGALSKVGFVAVKSLIGGAQASIIAVAYTEVTRGLHAEGSEVVKEAEIAFAAGMVGGGIGDGAGELWEDARMPSPETDVPRGVIAGEGPADPSAEMPSHDAPAGNIEEPEVAPQPIPEPERVDGADPETATTDEADEAREAEIANGRAVFAAAGLAGTITTDQALRGGVTGEAPLLVGDPNVTTLMTRLGISDEDPPASSRGHLSAASQVAVPPDQEVSDATPTRHRSTRSEPRRGRRVEIPGRCRIERHDP